MRRWLMILFFSWIGAVSAAQAVYQFDTAQQEALYNKLIIEFRCLVCQNQNIADSDADLAADLRQKTYELIMAGQQEPQIKAYMQQRYGDFVLYSPPVTSSTWLLWGLPVVILFVALISVYFAFRRYKQVQPS